MQELAELLGIEDAPQEAQETILGDFGESVVTTTLLETLEGFSPEVRVKFETLAEKDNWQRFFVELQREVPYFDQLVRDKTEQLAAEFRHKDTRAQLVS